LRRLKVPETLLLSKSRSGSRKSSSAANPPGAA
jgi:hypothetical protein